MTVWREAPMLALVLAGFFVLGVTVVPSSVVVLVAAVLCVAAPRGIRVLRELPWAVLTAGVACGLPVAFLLGIPFALVLVLALTYLQLRYRLARRGPHDDQASALIATLMLVLAVVLDDTPLLGIGLLVWAVALPLALLRAELETFRGSSRDAGRVQRWGLRPVVAILVLSVPVFLLLPRLRGSVHLPDLAAVPEVSRTGFTSQVALGGGASLLLDSETPVFRVTTSVPLTESVYFRGLTLDSFDGTTWRRSDRSPHDGFPAASNVGVRFDVELEPSADGLLFTTGRVLSLDAPVSVDASSDDVFQVRRHGSLRYSFVAVGPFGAGAAPDVDAGDLHIYRTLPKGRDARLSRLAVELGGTEGSREERVRRVSEGLRQRYAYTRQMPDRTETDPLTDFLFVQQEGHCEYFASAMAVLSRELGVPSRVVNGYVGGDRSPVDGSLLVREGHAHAWTEVWLEDRWVVIDATPGAQAPAYERSSVQWRLDQLEVAWRTLIVGYDAQQQREWALGVGSSVARPFASSPGPEVAWVGLGAGVLALATALVGLWLWRGRHWVAQLSGQPPPEGPRGRVAASYDRARRVVRRAGWRVPAHLPPVEAAEWLVAEVGDAARPLLELAWLHYEVRYGGASDDELAGRAAVLQEALAELTAPPSTR